MTTTYLAQYLFAGLLPLALVAYFAGRRKIRTQQDPNDHYKASENLFGWYAVTKMLIPGVLISAAATVLDLFDLMEVPWPMVAATILLIGAGALWLGVRAINPKLRVRTSSKSSSSAFCCWPRSSRS